MPTKNLIISAGSFTIGLHAVGGLVVSTGDLVSTGEEGGPFTPSSDLLQG